MTANDDPQAGDSERRRHYRPLARLSVTILSRGGQPLHADATVETADLAIGGVRCTCSMPITAGALLRLRLALEGGSLKKPATIEAEVEVLRCSERPGAPHTRRYDVAMQFSRMNPADRKILQAYVNGL